jgi:rhodanese-related sulfurtransferase
MKFNRISVNNLRGTLKQDAAACQLLDVRDRTEFAREHIDGSVNVPLVDLKRDPDRVARDRPVFLVCKSGKLADEAASLLEQRGYTNISVVAGGLMAWSTQGFPLRARDGWLMRREGRIMGGLLILFCTMICCDGRWSFVLLPALFAVALILSAFADLLRPLKAFRNAKK